MTTDSLTVSRNTVIALSVVIPLVIIILLIVILWLYLTLRRFQSHESDEFPLRSSHSTTSMPTVYNVPRGFDPCFAVVGTKDSAKDFLEARGYKNPTGSYERAFGHFRVVCNPSLNDTGVHGVIMLDDASLSDKIGWAYTRKEVVFVGPDPVMPPCLPRSCTLGLVDPLPSLVKKVSSSFHI
ncbi:hypothetical protein FAGAP_8245 [Fusarium agapanthi]|uniref:Uncharacterized protein n=1 Tax=Fusarium agapanthi TaxID=1803897 RepID=A0A9P5B4U4_9HYPO|nr:hypothetical protein FAGAP_8245 [Fusarium agapanthi]